MATTPKFGLGAAGEFEAPKKKQQLALADAPIIDGGVRIDDAIRNMTLGYKNANGVLPSPVTVAEFVDSGIEASEQEYKNIFSLGSTNKIGVGASGGYQTPVGTLELDTGDILAYEPNHTSAAKYIMTLGQSTDKNTADNMLDLEKTQLMFDELNSMSAFNSNLNTVTDLKTLLNLRRAELGLKQDSSDALIISDEDKHAVYEGVVGRVLPYLYSNSKANGDQKLKAAGLLDLALSAEGIKSGAVETLMDQLNAGGEPNLQLGKSLLDGFVFWRPQGTSIESAQEEFYNLCPDITPTDLATSIQSRRKGVMDYVGSALKTAAGAVKTAAVAVDENVVHPVAAAAGEVEDFREDFNDFLRTNPYTKDLYSAASKGVDVATTPAEWSKDKAAALLHKVSPYIGTITSTMTEYIGEGAMAALKGYEVWDETTNQGILTVAAMVNTLGENPSDFVSANEWAERWKSKEHLRVVAELAESCGLDTDNPDVRSAIAIGDFGATVIRDCGAGKILKIGSKAIASLAFSTARKAAGTAAKVDAAVAVGEKAAEAAKPPARASRWIKGVKQVDVEVDGTIIKNVDAGAADATEAAHRSGFNPISSHSGISAEHRASATAAKVEKAYLEIAPASEEKAAEFASAAKRAGWDVEEKAAQAVEEVAPVEAAAEVTPKKPAAASLTEVTEENVDSVLDAADAQAWRDVQEIESKPLREVSKEQLVTVDRTKAALEEKLAQAAKAELPVDATASANAIGEPITALTEPSRIMVSTPVVEDALLKEKWAALAAELGGETTAAKVAKLPWGVRLLLNQFEVIQTTTGENAAYALRRAFAITDGGKPEVQAEIKSLVFKLARTTDKMETLDAITRLNELGVGIDGFATGLAKQKRISFLLEGKIAGRPTPLGGISQIMVTANSTSLAEGTDNAIYELSKLFKMGKSEWTKADAQRGVRYANEMYKATTVDERAAILDKFWAEVNGSLSGTPCPKSAKLAMRVAGVHPDVIKKMNTMDDYFEVWSSVFRGEKRLMSPRAKRITDNWHPRGKPVEAEGGPEIGSTKKRRLMKADAAGNESSTVIPPKVFRKLAVEKKALKAELAVAEAEGNAAQKALLEQKIRVLDGKRGIIGAETRNRIVTQEKCKEEYLKALADDNASPERVKDALERMNKADEVLSDTLDKYAEAIATVNDPAIVGKKLEQARAIIDDFTERVPFWEPQNQSAYFHPRSPLMLARFQAGPAFRMAQLANSTRKIGLGFISIDEATALYKQLILTNYSTALRVSAADEAVRTVPEGTLWRWRHNLGVTKQLGAEGKLPKELLTHEEGLGRAWTFGHNSGDYVRVMPGMVGHYEGFSTELRFAREEEAVFGPWKENGYSIDKALPLIRKEISAKTERGARLRAFLMEEGGSKRATLASLESGALNENVENWLKQKYNYYKKIEGNEKLLDIYKSGKVTKKAYKALDVTDLWPVTWLNRVGESGGKSIPGLNWWGQQKWGPFGVMESINDTLQRVTYGSYYERFSKDILKRMKASGATIDEQAIDLAHVEASEKAMLKVTEASYTANVTVMEDVLRNVFLFLPAYRQFAKYWSKILLKHPLPMTGVSKQLTDKDSDNPLAHDSWSLPFGDYSMPNMARPFFAEEGWALAPNFGPAVTTPIRIAAYGNDWDMGWAAGTPLAFANTSLSGAGPLPDIYFALTGKGMGPLGKDVDVYQRAELAYRMAQVCNGQAPDGKGFEDIQNNPAYEEFLGKITSRPAVVTGLFSKMFLGTGKITKKLDQSFFNDLMKWRDGDAKKKSELRQKSQKLDTFLKYYQSGTEVREQMLLGKDGKWLQTYACLSPNMQDALFRSAGFSATKYDVTVSELKKAQQAGYEAIYGAYGALHIDAAYAQLKKKRFESTAWAVDRLNAIWKEQFGGTAAQKKDFIKVHMLQWSDPNEWTYDNGKWVPPDMFSGTPSESNYVAYAQAFVDGYNGKESETHSAANILEALDGTLPPKIAALAGAPTKRSVEVSQLLENYMVSPADMWKGTAFEKDAVPIALQIDTENRVSLVRLSRNPGSKFTLSMLTQLGIPADSRTTYAVEGVRQAYEEYKRVTNADGATAATKRAARLWFNETRENILLGRDANGKKVGEVPGGDYLLAGAAKILPLMPYFNGNRDVEAMVTEDSDKKVLKALREYAKKSTTTEKQDNAIMAAREHMTVQGKTAFDSYIAGYWWKSIISSGAQLRTLLKTSYSDYYKGPGNSVGSKVGKAALEAYTGWIDSLAGKNAVIASDIKTYFGDSKSLARELIDWYWR